MSKQKIQESKKVKTVRAIVKLYFVAALAGSFSHIVTSAYKMGATVWYEAWATPLLIDGLAVIGMIMRSEDFSKRTNKIGFILQCVMGSFSLAMNVYAGLSQSFFGVAFGVALVACFILAEWLKDNIESREVDEERETIALDVWKAACSHPTKCSTMGQCQTKTAAALKAKKTTAKKARARKVQEKALESLLQPVTEPGVRVMQAA